MIWKANNRELETLLVALITSTENLPTRKINQSERWKNIASILSAQAKITIPPSQITQKIRNMKKRYHICREKNLYWQYSSVMEKLIYPSLKKVKQFRIF